LSGKKRKNMTIESSGLEPDRYAFLDQPEVTRVLFHPRHDPPNRPVPLRVRTVRIPVDEGINVGGRLHRAKPAGPTILFFHGNGEIASDYDGISPLYTGLGINLFVVDYRGYGSSDGRPTASRLLADAVTTYERTGSILAENELKTSPMFVMGRSLGSAAAIEIAQHASDEIGGLIIESGFAYTLPLLQTLGLRWDLDRTDEARDGFGNLDKIAEVRVPTLIIHGQDDWLIPVENAHALHERSGADDKRLLTVPGAGHNDLMFVGQTAYFEALRACVVGEWSG
jgi:pimeloyl-ACP methyl ester carboxylesterase